MGDATFPGLYVQNWLADLGITGPIRVAVMSKMRIFDDEVKKANKIRAKRPKDNKAAATDETPA
jgi:hypothetical protein